MNENPICRGCPGPMYGDCAECGAYVSDEYEDESYDDDDDCGCYCVGYDAQNEPTMEELK